MLAFHSSNLYSVVHFSSLEPDPKLELWPPWKPRLRPFLITHPPALMAANGTPYFMAFLCNEVV